MAEKAGGGMQTRPSFWPDKRIYFDNSSVLIFLFIYAARERAPCAPFKSRKTQTKARVSRNIARQEISILNYLNKNLTA